jgi:hypothetical protein
MNIFTIFYTKPEQTQPEQTQPEQTPNNYNYDKEANYRIKHAERNAEWFANKLIKMSFRVNKDIKISYVFHLLLFLLKDGDICYFTSSIKLQQYIIALEENLEILKEFCLNFMAEHFCIKNQFIPPKVLIEIKEAVQKKYNELCILKSVINKHVVDHNLYTCETVKEAILNKLRTIVHDNLENCREEEIKALENDFELLEKYKSYLDFDEICHNCRETLENENDLKLLEKYKSHLDFDVIFHNCETFFDAIK